MIDLLVYCERVLKNRRVYLDFMNNPCGLDELPFDKLKKEACDYLKNADACFGTPIERLIQMNEPAYMLYKEKGVDLKCERLEIALCAQHNNGGLVTSQMTRAGGAIRELDDVNAALADSQSYIKEFENRVKTTKAEGLRKVYRLRDLLYTQCAVLTAFKDYMNHGGKSRGSAIYCTRNGKAPDGFDNSFAFLLDSGEFDSEVQNIRYNGKEFTAEWRSVRPLPEGGGFFETVWKAYRENKNVF